uniref:alpha-1,2-Mannosidase n=1 Tax=Heterorhabditis bacteriophora TaxID=37862 RepID=A0A1I7X8B1_HETBA
MESQLLRYSEPNKLAYVGELLGGNNFSPKMDHLVCFLSGTLALGSVNGLPARHMDIAKDLGKACRAMYENPTGLGPEIVYYNMLPGNKEDLIIKPRDAHSLLRPEAVEAWFYLYRLTGDKTYQEWGWKAFEAIEKYAKVTNGYSSVNSVKKIPVTYRDLMESFYLAETLKYLYLLFADDQSILPLDKWVFNTEAHPLPIYN